MSDGVSHFLLGKNLPIPYGIISGMAFYDYSGDLALSVSVGVTTFAGLYTSIRFLGPDVDLPGRTFNERGLIGKFISIFWSGVLSRFTHHRGILHKPPIGTLILYAPIMAVLCYLAYIHIFTWYIPAAYFAGAFIGDVTHVLADYDAGLKKILANRDKFLHEH